MDIVERLRNCEEASRLALFKFNFAILLEAADEIERLREESDKMFAWSNHLLDSGIILADAVMNARKSGYVLPSMLHNSAVNPLDLFLAEKERRSALQQKDSE